MFSYLYDYHLTFPLLIFDLHHLPDLQFSSLHAGQRRGDGHEALGVPEPAALGAVAVRQVHVVGLGLQHAVRRYHCNIYEWKDISSNRD